MALIRCSHHQLQGIDLVCSHIAKSIDTNENIETIISLDLISDDSLNSFEAMDCTVFYCPTCAEQYDFPLKDDELPESEYENVVGKGFKGVCSKCFKLTQEMSVS